MSRAVTDMRAARGWMLFDFAAQPIFTLILTFVFAPYFTSAVASDPASGQALWGYATAAAGVGIAVLSPVLGAVADATGPRKPWVAGFGLVYVLGCAALWWAVPGMANPLPILAAFVLALMAAEFATTFTNAMLPDFASREDIGRISGAGWALGFVGGVILLVLTLTLLAEDDAGRTLLGTAPIGGLDASAREGTRSVGPISAIWFAVFIVPFFLWVPDQPRRPRAPRAISTGLSQLALTLRRLPARRHFALYLLASMSYRDALAGLFIFGGIYAQGVLGLSVVDVGVFGIVSLVAGIFGSFWGGRLDSRHGPRPVILWSIVLLILACVAVVLTTPGRVVGIPVAEGSSLPRLLFYVAGGAIGAAAGPLQAASRTMLVFLSPPERMTESFGLYALAGKASAFVTPFAIALLTDWSGSQQIGVTPIVLFFILGLVLLLFVKVDAVTKRG